jgi:DNA-binding NarL/FixJ family response regulator
VDGHPLVRIGVKRVLEEDYEVHESASREEAVDLVRDIGDFDVAIVEMQWRPNGSGAAISAADAIRLMRRTAPVLGIVGHGERPERHLANAALGAGASAYVARTAGPTELKRAVAAAALQERFLDPDVPAKGSRGKLTQRQREILQLLADGESTGSVGRELDLSEETVKTHMKNALGRLGARNRSHAVAIALRESLIV